MWLADASAQDRTRHAKRGGIPESCVGLSGVLLGVTPYPLRGAAPPSRVPRQDFVLNIHGGPGVHSITTRVLHVFAELGEVLHAQTVRLQPQSQG